jgi:ABC-type antimicrobial peptide transport system permease subunit
MKAGATDPGFPYDRELLVSLDPSLAGYGEARGAAGIRMALGASSTDVVWMVLRDGAKLTLLGLAIGFPLALGLAQFLSRVLVDVSPFDPIALAPTTLAAAAALAS